MESLPSLHVVQIRYQGDKRALPGSDPVDRFAASGAYNVLGERFRKLRLGNCWLA
jgi:hypothetical protein